MEAMVMNHIEEEKEINAVLGLLKIKGRDKVDGKKTLYQNLVLRRIFKIIKYPSQQTQRDLAILLNLGDKSVKLWFQNERQSQEKSSLRNNFIGFEISPLILYRICKEVTKEISHKPK